MERVEAKEKVISEIATYFQNNSISPEEVSSALEEIGSAPLRQKNKLDKVLARPHVGIDFLRKNSVKLNEFLNSYENEFIESAEIEMKYEGYIAKEKEQADKMLKLEEIKINPNYDYNLIKSISIEARQKLLKIKPATLGQASRISGVSPADISVLLIHMGR
jgi:tRNA uridine 5-carboxymethylaminomethyl modification enzyme